MAKFTPSNAFGQVADKIVSAVKQVATKAGAKLPKFSKMGVAKAAGNVWVAKEVTTAIAKTPIWDALKLVINPIEKLQDWGQRMTVERIPGVGPLFKKFNDWGYKFNQTVTRWVSGDDTYTHARFQREETAAADSAVNNPQWYQNLDTHAEYKLPVIYPDNFALPPIDFRRHNIAKLELLFNPRSSETQRLSRTNQLFDLLKGLRGLSSTNYTPTDIMDYQDRVLFAINEYGRLKFGLRLAHYYALVKPNFPNGVLAMFGFNNEFIANRANYANILNSLHNFIMNSMPISGDIVNKIFHSWDAFVPDCDNLDVATLYKTNLLMALPSTGVGKWWGPFFNENSLSFPDINQMNKNIPVEVDAYLTNMNAFMNQFYANEKFSYIRADMVGAFGSSVMWKDNNFKDINSTAGLIHSFDALYLTMIQNATLVAQQIASFVPVTQGVGSATMLAPQIYLDHAAGHSTQPGATAALNVRYVGSSGASFVLPPMEGFSGTVLTKNKSIASTTAAIVVNTHKRNMTEGEALEISQLQSYFQRATASTEGNNTYCLVRFLTHDFIALNLEVMYFTGEATTSREYIQSVPNSIVMNSIRYDRNNFPIKVLQNWAQLDWAPKVYTFDVSNDLVNVNVLLDTDMIASVNLDTFILTVDYATYSLYAASVGSLVNNQRISNAAQYLNFVEQKSSRKSR